MEENVTDKNESGECLFCKSPTALAAVKCPHCHANLMSCIPRHGGKCPLCRSEIHDNALRCKHCKSWLVGQYTRAVPLLRDEPPSPMARMANLPQGIAPSGDFGSDEVGGEDFFDVPSRGFFDLPPQSWHCQSFDDWSTFDPRTNRLWVFERCVEVNSKTEFVRPVRSRKVTPLELARWQEANT